MASTGFRLEENPRVGRHRDDRASGEDSTCWLTVPISASNPERRRRWVGSSNQGIHLLTRRYDADDRRRSQPNTLELRLKDGELTVNGFPADSAVGLWNAPARGPRPEATMRSVNRFQADLLNVLHAVLGTIPLEVALPAIARHRKRPSCLGRDAVDLVQDALAKGSPAPARPGRKLAAAAATLRGDLVASGRLWDRTPPKSLD